MRYFTHFWAPEAVEADIEEAERTGSTYAIDNTVGAGFADAGVTAGDALYVAAWVDGGMHILGRFIVRDVLDTERARAELGVDVDVDEVVVAEPGRATFQVFDAVLNGPDVGVGDELLDLVEIIADDDVVIPNRDGGVVALQGLGPLCEVSADTASLFDELLGFELDQVIDPDAQLSRRLMSTDYYDGDDGIVSVDVVCETGALIGRWRDADLPATDPSTLGDPEALADAIWAELQHFAGHEDITILTGRAEVIDQVREAMAEED